jgi:hypothetical protein
MTPAAKEGPPAVVGELVAAIDRAQRVSRPLLSPDGGTSFEATVNFVNAFDAIRKSLSALTAEAGKGEVTEDEDGMPVGYADWYNTKFFGQQVDTRRDHYCEEAWRSAIALSTATPAGEWVPRELLESLLKRDEIPYLNGECECINRSRASEREYESGICPHQRLRAMLAASHRGAGGE